MTLPCWQDQADKDNDDGEEDDAVDTFGQSALEMYDEHGTLVCQAAAFTDLRLISSSAL